MNGHHSMGTALGWKVANDRWDGNGGRRLDNSCGTSAVAYRASLYVSNEAREDTVMGRALTRTELAARASSGELVELAIELSPRNPAQRSADVGCAGPPGRATETCPA